jgi:small subunit ribosomal protein S9
MPKQTSKIKKTIKETAKLKERYIEAVGRRKTAVARVRLYPDDVKSRDVSVNGKTVGQYFPLKRYQETALAAFRAVNAQYKTTVKLEGSGLNAQAEAVRLGIARALVSINSSSRSLLKQLGYLKRDPRMVERKHPGLRKARRAQQWRKR